MAKINRSTSDHVDEHIRNGGVRPAGGRGGGNVRRCYRCSDPGHIIRDCPVPGPSTRNNVRR